MMPCSIRRPSILASRNTKLFPALSELQGLLCLLSRGSFPGSRSFPHMHMQIRTQTKAWQHPLENSSVPCAALSLVFCPANCLQWDHRALSPSLHRSLETLQVVSWNNHRTHLIYFPESLSCTACHPVSENFCFTDFVQLCSCFKVER